MSSKLKAALKEPLLHFIALGALIFLGYEFLRPGDDHPGAEIVVSDARAASMVQTFIRTWQRPPTESEFNRLIDDYIKTEIFVREALALGLLGKAIPIHAIKTEDYPTAATRPAYSVLDCSSTIQAINIQPAEWRTNLRRMLKGMTE